MAWYTREQWELLLQVAADWNSLEPAHEEWLAHAEDAVRILTQSGYRVRTVDVDVAELLAWCKRQKRKVDGESRSDFVEEKVEQRYSRKKEPE